MPEIQMSPAWVQHFEGIQEDVGAFYGAVEEAVKRKQLPEVTFRRVAAKEGGIFSSSREFLHVSNEDTKYVIYAAHYANGMFVSARLYALGKFADSLQDDMKSSGFAGNVAAIFTGSRSYLKLDTAQVYLKLVHAGLMEAVDTITSKKGQPALGAEDRKPTMNSFFQ